MVCISSFLSRMLASPASLVAHTPLTWQGSPGKVDTEAGPAATLSLPRSDLSKSRVLVITGE